MHADQPKESGSFSIVIVGSMNAHIHHPLWYKLNNLLNESEADEATKTATILPDLAQFTFGAVQVLCRPDRWDVVVTDVSLRPRILELATRVFDERLRETPIRLIGLNNDLKRKIPSVNVPKAIGSRIANAAFGLENLEPDTGGAHFTIGIASPDRINIRVEALLAEEVLVAVNSNHPVSSGTRPFGYFDLGPMIAEHFDADLERAKKYADTIASSLATVTGEIHAH